MGSSRGKSSELQVPTPGVHLDNTTILRRLRGARPSSGAATSVHARALKYPSAPSDSGLAAPEDGRAPVVLSRCTPTPARGPRGEGSREAPNHKVHIPTKFQISNLKFEIS